MLYEAAYALALQLLLGTAAYLLLARAMPGRRWAGTWGAFRCPGISAALLLLVLVPLRLLVAGGASPGVGPAIWIVSWRFVAIGALGTASCWLILRAAASERRGRLRRARREVRRGGLIMFGGILGLLILLWSDLLFQPAFRNAVVREAPIAGLFLLAGMVSLGCAAFIGALAGLSGKPRPSAYFATAFFLVGQLGVMQSGHLALALAAP